MWKGSCASKAVVSRLLSTRIIRFAKMMSGKYDGRKVRTNGLSGMMRREREVGFRMGWGVAAQNRDETNRRMVVVESNNIVAVDRKLLLWPSQINMYKCLQVAHVFESR